MKTISSSELASTEIVSNNWRAIARKFKPSNNLSFEITDGVKIGKKQIILTGNLSNKSNNPEEIIVFPTGNLGFYASIMEDKNIRYVGSKCLPQEPPPPTEVRIPANSLVKYEYAIDLADFEYSGTPKVRIAWSFNYWNEPRPKGLIRFRLPKRTGRML